MHFMREIRLRRVKCLRAWVEDDLLGGCTPWRCHTLASDFKKQQSCSHSCGAYYFQNRPMSDPTQEFVANSPLLDV